MIPAAPGEYTVRATVSETRNYEGGQAFADFKISQSKSEPEPSPLPAPVISYTVIAGDGSTWTKGSGADISFTFKRNATDEEVDMTFSHFVGVAVDGD